MTWGTTPSDRFARDRTKGARADHRRRIRGKLGTSSDPAPTVLDVLHTLPDVANLLLLASGGRYTVAVIDNEMKDTVKPYEARRVAEAALATDRHSLWGVRA